MGTKANIDTSLDAVAREVVGSLLEGCQVVGFDMTYLYVNDAVIRQSTKSREELLGRTMMECYPGIEATPMFEVLRLCMKDRGHHRMENAFTFSSGESSLFELRFVPVPMGVCILSLDITERRRIETALLRSEEQLRHAQKMEAVGRLAGGLAHDFNNLLSVILSYAGLILEDIDASDPVHADVGEIRRAGERAAELARQLLAFSHQQVLELKVLNLNDAILGVEKMVRRLLGADIEISLLRSSTPTYVRIDPGQFEQIVMNLVVNARDAMPRGGKLAIRTSHATVDDRFVTEHPGSIPGSYVVMTVTDSGCGMDRETQKRIFEPFFTTKEKGRGTGLGLSTVFGIVKGSGGHLTVDSAPNEGTSFNVYLPRVDDDEEAVTSQTFFPKDVRGSETILLVEDDDQVRGAARGILTRNGYLVLEAPGAGEALLISEQHDGPIDLLLTGVVMARMDGSHLAERLHATRPAMRVLFMSGYTGEVLERGIHSAGGAFLQKPFTPDSLTHGVRELLGPRRI